MKSIVSNAWPNVKVKVWYSFRRSEKNIMTRKPTTYTSKREDRGQSYEVMGSFELRCASGHREYTLTTILGS